MIFFLSEVLNNALRDEEKDEQLYNFITHSAVLLDTLSEGMNNFHLVFLIKMTKFLGFYPLENRSVENPYFNLSLGSFCNELLPNTLNEPESLLFYNIMNTEYTSATDLSITNNQRQTLISRILVYYKLHLPGFKEPQSLDVLHCLFS